MNAFLSIASREVTTRGRVLAASLVVGLGALVVPLLVTTGASPAEMRGASAWTASLLLGLGVAALVGSALFGAPLAEGRASFWLSRPASTTAIWAGKVLGAFALVLLSSVLSILPGALTGTHPFGRLTWPALLAANLGACFLLLLVASAASVAVRSRSAWIAADLLLLGLTALFAWKAFENVAWVGLLTSDWLASGDATTRIALALSPVAALLCIGTWAAVSRGRADIRQAHRAQALSFWIPLVGLTAILLGASSWYAHPPISALRIGWTETAGSSGSWIVANGRAKNRPGGYFHFLVDTATGRSVRLDRTSWAVVSGDGSRAVLGKPVSLSAREIELVSVDLGSPRFLETALPGSFPSILNRIVLSPDGSMVALTDELKLSVLEVPSGRLLGSVSLPKEAGNIPEPVFRGAAVALLPRESFDPAKKASTERIPGLAVCTFDVRARKLSPPVRLDVAPVASGARFTFSPDGTRLLVRRGSSTSFPTDVVDASSGHLVFRITPGEGARIAASGFLSDGSVFAAERSDASTVIRHFTANGIEGTSIPVPGGRVRFRAGGEFRPGLLAGTVVHENASGEPVEERSRTVVVDLNSGTLRETTERARPVLVDGRGGASGARPPPVGSAVTRAFQGGETILTGIPGEGPLVPLALH